jgi:outer membrane lipoprotein carrier protein
MGISRFAKGPAIPALILLLSSVLPAQTGVHSLAARVDRRYDHMHTLQARFTETYTGAGMSRTESGTLLLKKPGRMRWDYGQPRPKLFLSDGQTAWFYVPGERQARRTPVKQLDDLRSPLRYLLGKTKLEKELDGLSLAPDQPPVSAGDIVLRGIPKGMRDRVEQTLLEVTPDGLIVRSRGIGRLDNRISLSSAAGERRTSRPAISLYSATRRRSGGRNGIHELAFSTQYSALSIQHSVFSTQYSALSIRIMRRFLPCTR